MAVTDKELLIRVRADIQKAQEHLRQIETSIKGINSAASKPIPDPTPNLNNGLETTKKSAIALRGELTALFSLALIYRGVKAAMDATRQLQNSFMGLMAVANYTGVGIKRAWEEVTTLSKDGLLSVADAAKSLQNLLSRGYSLEQAVETITRLKDAAAYNRAAHLSMSQAVLTATEGLKNENSILVDNAGVTKNVSVMWQEYAKSIGKTAGQLSQAEKIQAEYLGIQKETAAQVGNAAEAVNGVEGKVARFNKAAQELGETLGDALLPSFTTLAEWGTWLVNEVFKPLIAVVQSLSVYAAASAKSVADAADGNFSQIADNFKLANEMSREFFDNIKNGNLSVLQIEPKVQSDDLKAQLADLENEINTKQFQLALIYNDPEKTAALKKDLNSLKEKYEELGRVANNSQEDQADNLQDIDKKIKTVNKSLNEQISIYKQQVSEVKRVQNQIDDMARSSVEARKAIQNMGGEGKGPDVIDISKQLLDAENLAQKGDSKGAIAGAENARDMIKELANAGSEAGIVLEGLLKRADKISGDVAKGTKASLQAQAAETSEIITKLATEAKKLENLKVGLNVEQATQDAESFRAALQADFDANPLVLSVKITQKGETEIKPLGETQVRPPADVAIPGYSGGGQIRGPGSGTSDSVLMYGSNGEFVLKDASVRHYGLAYLNDLNNMRIPRYADGGLITRDPVSIPTSSPPTVSGGTPVHLHLGDRSYQMNASKEVAEELRREVTIEAIKRGDTR